MLSAFSTARSEETVDASELSIVIGVAGDIVVDFDNSVLAVAFFEGFWQAC